MITPIPQDNTTIRRHTLAAAQSTQHPITDSIGSTLSHISSTALHHIMLFHGYDSDDDPLPYGDRGSYEESDCDDEESNTADEDDDIASTGDHSDDEFAVEGEGGE